MPIYDCTPGGGGSTTTGVSSFNGRTGAVMPQAGDYTAAQVGAADATTTQQALQTLSDEVDGILSGTSPVNIPPASEVKVGGIKVGEGLSATTDGTTNVAISPEADNATGILNGALYTSIPRPSAVYPLVEVTTVPATASIHVTATKGELSVQGTTDENGKVDIELSAFGVWTFTATIDGEQATADVAVNASQLYTLKLSPYNVFGVAWDKTNPSTQLTRLTPTTDPNGLVTVEITTEPQPAVGTGNGSSPFDNYAPWSGMYVCNLSSDGTETAKQGDASFSYSTADVMVYIPEFYYRVIDTADIRYFYIAEAQSDGFSVHPGSGKYLARYISSNGPVSVTGQPPWYPNGRRTAARSGVQAKGTGWNLEGTPIHSAYIMLYLIEFADFNCQNAIAQGNVSTSSILNSGMTDAMSYHTGRPEGVDGHTAVQYRWVENPWGNVMPWLDGILTKGNGIFVSSNEADWNDSDTSNFTNLVSSLPEGYITGLSHNETVPWALIPVSVGGSSSTYVPDYYTDPTTSGTFIPIIGGQFNEGEQAGLFRMRNDFLASYTSTSGYYLATRMQFAAQEASL